jgi:transmembrane sensor
MSEFAHRISELITKYHQDKLTEEESEELQSWRNQSDYNNTLFEELTSHERLVRDLVVQESSKTKIFHRLRQLFPELDKTIIYKTNWRYIAAAGIVGMMFIGGYYFLHIKASDGRKGTEGESYVKEVITDVPAPSGTRTILTLANGAQIVLDSVKNGTLAQQGNANISKLNNDQLAYNNITSSLHGKPTEILYNTLSTAKGGQTTITLSDGSKVFLNAASSIRFPTVFSGKERTVEMTGEAYFEIAQNKSMPFIVNVKNARIKVLGTHFNVMAYEDEPILQATLLEGSVVVSEDNLSKYLKPGQQASIKVGQTIKVNDDVDTAQTVAWKNGEFQFDITEMESIMRQLERWYSIDVEYEGGQKPGIRLSGSISRTVNLSSVLRLMEDNGAHLRVDGKKVTVLK